MLRPRLNRGPETDELRCHSDLTKRRAHVAGVGALKMPLVLPFYE
jgi:hypothetical protein